MGPPDWDPEQYARFAAERAQPARDLAAMIATDRPIERVVDLGCGSGELTVELADRLDAAEVLGIDSSPAMLDQACGLARPGVRFEQGDLATWTAPGHHDLVFANASLHWVGDHPQVLARWVAALRPGGQLAVQVPANADHPAHLAAGAVAAREPFVSALGGAPPPDPVAANVLHPERYATLLHELGAVDQQVRLQVYGHVLDSTAAVVEWTKGSTLTRFSGRLPGALYERFLEEYAALVVESLGAHAPYFHTFKRILLWARMA